MVCPKSSGVSHNKNASTYHLKRSTGEATSSTLSSSVRNSITELWGIILRKGKAKAKENEREQQVERMEIVKHDSNHNDGLEDDASMQNAILSDPEGSESVSEERAVDTMENQEPAGNDKYSFLIVQKAQARWEELYEFAVYSALHKRWACRICSEYG